MSSLPQHSLTAFKRYEGIIADAVRIYPELLLIGALERKSCVLPSSIHTCAARCRDAINALLLNADNPNWTQVVNIQRLREIKPDFSIGIKDATLVLGPKRSVREYTSIRVDIQRQRLDEPNADSSQPPTNSSEIKDGQKLNLQTLCALMSRNELKHPYFLGKLAPNMVEPLEKEYSVAIVWDEKLDGHVLIL